MFSRPTFWTVSASSVALLATIAAIVLGTLYWRERDAPQAALPAEFCEELRAWRDAAEGAEAAANNLRHNNVDGLPGIEERYRAALAKQLPAAPTDHLTAQAAVAAVSAWNELAEGWVARLPLYWRVFNGPESIYPPSTKLRFEEEQVDRIVKANAALRAANQQLRAVCSIPPVDPYAR